MGKMANKTRRMRMGTKGLVMVQTILLLEGPRSARDLPQHGSMKLALHTSASRPTSTLRHFSFPASSSRERTTPHLIRDGLLLTPSLGPSAPREFVSASKHGTSQRHVVLIIGQESVQPECDVQINEAAGHSLVRSKQRL